MYCSMYCHSNEVTDLTLFFSCKKLFKNFKSILEFKYFETQKDKRRTIIR